MEKFCEAILVTILGDVITIMSLKWRHIWSFKVCFCHNLFERPQFGQITQI